VAAWPTNAELIADVARLGYIGGRVWDATYGRGVWWNAHRPLDLVASDIDPALSPLGIAVDFTCPPARLGRFDTIAFDPPYKLNGTPDPANDARYGTHVVLSWQDRHALIELGIVAQAGMLNPGGHLLLKCQDQVCSGQVRWQTKVFAERAESCGLRQVDRFDMIGHARPQPMDGRLQRTAHGRPSTLLVFRKGRP
jgi:hypothetical protein